jgi:hypothetical protein
MRHHLTRVSHPIDTSSVSIIQKPFLQLNRKSCTPKSVSLEKLSKLTLLGGVIMLKRDRVSVPILKSIGIDLVPIVVS